MAAAESPPELIPLLRKPLEFAASLDPSRLCIVKDLEANLRAILKSHPAEPAPPGFAKALTGLDQLPGPERMARVIELIRLLDKAQRKPGKAAPPPTPPAASLTEFERQWKDLETPVQYVKGVGPNLAQRLARMGINTVEDLLFHLPSRYDDRRDVVEIRTLHSGDRATIVAQIMGAGPVFRNRARRGFQMILYDGTGLITAKWFHYQEWLEKKFTEGKKVIATSTVKAFGRTLEMHHPEMELLDSEEDNEIGAVVPVYPLTEGVYQGTMRRVARSGLDSYLTRVPEILPEELRERRSMPSLDEALDLVHAPPEDADLAEYNGYRSPAHRRLVYDEFFFLELGLALRRRGMIEEPAVPIRAPGELMQQFTADLPFSLTNSQNKVVEEIVADLARPHPMHRLLQGDVGSGKTVVALLAALSVIEAGYQAAIMAPTEILAEQHHRNISGLCAHFGLDPVLLTGSVKGGQRSEAYEDIAAGRAQLVVGTHAVIQDKVKFKRLALGIIDEQHRFGVLQRAKLKAKGPDKKSPHLLVMTATPIPRTLAMTVYGDLAVSVIREMPPGRQPIKTKIFREKEVKKVHDLVRTEVKKGRQAYFLYPLVEESEKLELRDAMSMFERLSKKVFPDLRLGLIHGRMKGDEKDRVMRSFAAQEIDVLVATTVIEVGIDVPNATVMVIEHADRFGLSQLHQLRGRVGRGEHVSHCCLVTGFTRSQEAWIRLKVMERTSDGFKIAEEDLALRGPGEFFGTRQSGLPDFRVANIIRDAEVLSAAREDAFEVVRSDPAFGRPEHRVLREALNKRWGKRLKLGRVG